MERTTFLDYGDQARRGNVQREVRQWGGGQHRL
jgi:hypothetical protein